MDCANYNWTAIRGMAPVGNAITEPIELPPCQREEGYVRPPITDQTFVPEIYVLDSESRTVAH